MTDSPHVSALRRIAEEVVVTRRGVTWFGAQVVRLPSTLSGRPSQEQTNYLAAGLREVLYSHFYTVGRPLLHAEVQALRGAGSGQNFVSALHLANPGAGRLESGWRYLSPGRRAATLLVEKEGLRLTIPTEALVDPSGTARACGDEISVRVPAGAFNTSPGFYLAHSDAEFSYAEPLARFYLNAAPRGAPRMLRQLCTALNAQGFGFDLKVASDLATYYRADVAVLYMPRNRARAALPTIREVATASGGLRDATPALARRIEPGLAAADDPGDGESFGLHRCRIIADALAHDAVGFTAEARFESIKSAFVRAGIMLDRPHLSPGHVDIYGPHDRGAE